VKEKLVNVVKSVWYYFH